MKGNFKYSFLHELTKMETLALNLFATLGEASRYELFIEEERRQELKQNEKHTSYSTFYNISKSLLRHQLIYVTKTLPGKKNPQIKVEYYKLTLAGVIKLLLPLCGLYGWRVEASEEVYNYALELVGSLLKNYPEMFPPEFHELSDRFKERIAIEYSVNYVTSEIWELSPLIRAYTEDKSDSLTLYVEILLCKLGELEEWKEAMPPFLDYMTEKDVKVMVKLVERLLNHSDDLIKTAIKNTKSLKEEFQNIKYLISEL